MRLLNLTLAALFALTTSAQLLAPLQQCQKKNADAAAAIHKLCTRNDIVAGWNHQLDVFAQVKNTRAQIMPPTDSNSAGCDPPAWVPPYWCAKQFLDLCNSSKGGLGKKRYGKAGCQQFTLYKPGSNAANGL